MTGSKIQLTGQFVEAFLYYDFLWLLTIDGEVWAFDTIAYLHHKFGDKADLPLKAFTRNDDIPRTDNNRMIAGFTSSLARVIGREGISISEGDVKRFSRIFKAGKSAVKSILDFRCYYGHGFVATDAHVLQLRMLNRDELIHVHLGGKGNGALGGDMVADFRCRQFRTNFGMVSASAGPDGGYYASGAASQESSWRAKFLKFADASVATEVMGGAMANVSSEDEIAVFETDVHPVDGANRFATRGEEEQVPLEITEILDKRKDATNSLEIEMRRVADIKQTQFKKTFLSKTKVFAVDVMNRIYSLNVVDKGKIQGASFGRTFPQAPGPILSLGFTTYGKALAELDDSVCILDLHSGIWHSIFEGEVYSTRGYLTSKWYQNLVTCVGEDRVEVLFIA